jgi:hypothetical protein
MEKPPGVYISEILLPSMNYFQKGVKKSWGLRVGQNFDEDRGFYSIK